MDPEPINEKHALLLSIARRLRRSGIHYYGRVPYENLQRQDVSGMDPSRRARHDFDLAFEHFKFGNIEEAERLFLRSYEITKDPYTLYLAGVTQLRFSVVSNCIAMLTSEGCIFPLAGNGVPDASGPGRAIPTLTRVLESRPLGLRASARFLLNFAYMAVGEYPDGVPDKYLIAPSVFDSGVEFGRFRDLAPELGLATKNHAGGSAVDDFDGDGFLDIVTSTSFLSGQMLYYRNRGDGTLEERTEEAGLLGQVGGLNLVHADYDGDGHLDVLVLRGGWLCSAGRHPRSLLRNRGDGTFVDVTVEAGLDEVRYPSQAAAFADYDLDGDLDLFIGNEALIKEDLAYSSVGFEVPVDQDLPYPSQLFRNEGDGTFTDVAAEAGVTNLRYAKGCAWGDYDGDRDPDLYVSNQFGRNRLYRNEGDGTFTDVAPELGLTEPVYSFPVWFWDYDNDGNLDLFVASYSGGPNNVIRSYLRPSLGLAMNALYRNEGNGRFRNMAAEAGLTTLTLTMGANFADVDGDGHLDFYLATGTPRFDALLPNVLYRADGKGGFVDVTAAAGLGNLQKGHGVAFGDLDNDGDEDLFLQSGGFYDYDAFFNSLFENPGHGNRWITILLEGVDSNRFGVGSRIRVTVEEDGHSRDIYRWVGAAGSFGSSSVQQEIGLGRADRVARVEVWWPATDTRQVFEDVEMERFYRIREHARTLEVLDRTVVTLGRK